MSRCRPIAEFVLAEVKLDQFMPGAEAEVDVALRRMWVRDVVYNTLVEVDAEVLRIFRGGEWVDNPRYVRLGEGEVWGLSGDGRYVPERVFDVSEESPSSVLNIEEWVNRELAFYHPNHDEQGPYEDFGSAYRGEA